MRLLFTFVCVLALSIMGCGETSGTGGSGGDGGTGGDGGNGVACVDDVCPCTEAGIHAAIAEGGGPFTFDCPGPEPTPSPITVLTEAEIVIDNDVILEGPLDLDAGLDHRVLSVAEGVTAELRGFTITGGLVPDDQRESDRAGGIRNDGTLALKGCSVESNVNDGIYNAGTLVLTETYVERSFIDGIRNEGTLTLVESYVLNNLSGGIDNNGPLTLTSSTAQGISSGGTIAATNSTLTGGVFTRSGVTLTSSTVAGGLWLWNEAVESTIRSSIVEGECTCGEYGDVDCDDVVNSSGYNIESLGDSCGLNHETDKVSVSAVELKLEPLENGTHALGDGSVAIDVIPRAECDVETDQRGEPRPETGGSMCDVGAFEVQP